MPVTSTNIHPQVGTGKDVPSPKVKLQHWQPENGPSMSMKEQQRSSGDDCKFDAFDMV